MSDDLGEIKKAKDRFFSYKKNKQVPPDDIIEKSSRYFWLTEKTFSKICVGLTKFLVKNIYENNYENILKTEI